MSVRIRITESEGILKVGDELDALEIDEDGDAVITWAQKYGGDDDTASFGYLSRGWFEVIGQTDHIQRIEELEAEVARLRKLVPTVDQLPQEVGVWKSGALYYVRLGEDNWLYASAYGVERRTDAEMASGTRDGEGVPRIGEKIS